MSRDRQIHLATWNINSVRLRIDQVRQFVEEARIDVLCLQEIKCHEGEFPSQAFVDMGLPHLVICGQKGWHGVAIASRHPLERIAAPVACREGHARVVAVRVLGVDVHNYYVPAGGDEPDPEINPKFDHKLDFLRNMRVAYTGLAPDARILVVGDLNIAPGENDVWSHRQMLKVVSHTPVEVEALRAVEAAGAFVDLPRRAVPEPTKLYSWWSYRAQDFRSSNRGLRLDHIWATPALAPLAESDGGCTAKVHDAVRGWDRPSDHAPVSVILSL